MRQDQSRYRESEWAELDLLVDEACIALTDCGPRPSRRSDGDHDPADPPAAEEGSDEQVHADISALLARAQDPRSLLERLRAELAQGDPSSDDAEEAAPDVPDEPDGETPDA